jgi:hypothetical protein
MILETRQNLSSIMALYIRNMDPSGITLCKGGKFQDKLFEVKAFTYKQREIVIAHGRMENLDIGCQSINMIRSLGSPDSPIELGTAEHGLDVDGLVELIPYRLKYTYDQLS